MSRHSVYYYITCECNEKGNAREILEAWVKVPKKNACTQDWKNAE